MSAFERAAWFNESVFSKWPIPDNTKTFISKISVQSTRETNGFQCKIVWSIYPYGFRFCITTNL